MQRHTSVEPYTIIHPIKANSIIRYYKYQQDFYFFVFKTATYRQNIDRDFQSYSLDWDAAESDNGFQQSDQNSMFPGVFFNLKRHLKF